MKKVLVTLLVVGFVVAFLPQCGDETTGDDGTSISAQDSASENAIEPNGKCEVVGSKLTGFCVTLYTCAKSKRKVSSCPVGQVAAPTGGNCNGMYLAGDFPCSN